MRLNLSNDINNFLYAKENTRFIKPFQKKLFIHFSFLYNARTNEDFKNFCAFQKSVEQLSNIYRNIEARKKLYFVNEFDIQLSYYLQNLLCQNSQDLVALNFQKVSTDLLIQGLKQNGLNIFKMYQDNLLNQETIMLMLLKNYQLDNDENNVLFYQLKDSAIYNAIKELVKNGKIKQEELIDRMRWRDYYNLSYSEQERLGAHINFEKLCEKINTIHVFYEQLNEGDKNTFDNIQKHAIGAVKSAYIYANYLDKREKLDSITQQDMPRLIEKLNDIHIRYLSYLDKEVNIEKKFVNKLLHINENTKTLKAQK